MGECGLGIAMAGEEVEKSSNLAVQGNSTEKKNAG